MELRNKIIDVYGTTFWGNLFHKRREETEFKDTDGEWKSLPKTYVIHDLVDFH